MRNGMWKQNFPESHKTSQHLTRLHKGARELGKEDGIVSAGGL